jgi:hypothetical protein
MASIAQVVDRTATRLGVLAEGLALPSYESADLTEAYTEVYAQLDAKNLAVWDFDEPIPDEYVQHVVSLMAISRANDYSIPNDKYQRVVADARMAVPEIRELQAADAYQTPTPDYL